MAEGYADMMGFDMLSEAELQQVKDLTKGTLAEVIKYLDQKMRSKLQQPIQLAITGRSGVGKSTFINTYRGLLPGDEGAADIGIVETTMERARYPHPKHENLQLWDLPGVGTKTHPRDGYASRMRLDEYDALIIISKDRFTEDDGWLAAYLLGKGKRVVLLRSNFDVDATNYRKTKPRQKVDDEEIRKVILKNMKDELKKIDESIVDTVPLFLINCDDIMKYDFPKLQEHLYEALPDYKREALVHSMTTISDQLLKQKRELLRKRVFNAAMLGVVGALQPIPGVDLLVNLGVIKANTDGYIKEFGLDQAGMETIAFKHNIDIGELKAITDKYMPNMMNPSGEDTKALIQSMTTKLAMYGTLTAAQTVFDLALPIIGSIISAPLSYKIISDVLYKVIDHLHDCAVEINKFVIKRTEE